MYVSAKCFLFWSAALLLCLPACAAGETNSGAVAPPPRAVVICSGMPNVPMTSDPEQALPLNLVASLNCGGEVFVLSDDGGYTAHVRSDDGKEGYVAHMYLLLGKTPAAPEPSTPLPNAVSNGVARWNSGAPGCDQFTNDGRFFESLTANGITVQVSLQDTGWKLRATIAISNQTAANVDVTPALITLDELQPKMRTLPAQKPEKMAHSVNHQVLWTAADATPSPSAVAMRGNSSGTIQSTAFRENNAPSDLDKQFDELAAKNISVRDDLDDPRALALKSAALAPQQKVSGVMWFARDPGAHELSLRVPIGDIVFDFPLSFSAHR